MVFTPYLAASEYPAYGISDAKPHQVNRACRTVNTYLGRPEGLLWSPDANGQPAYMTGLNPTLSFTGSALAPGTGVTLTIANATFGYQDVGEVVILDRATPGLTEACVVTAASGNTLTLAAVQFTHATPTVDFGLTILEEAPVKMGTPLVRASRFPVANLLCGFSRYSFGKLPRQITDYRYAYEAFLLADVIGLSGPPAWTQMDTTQWDINYNTGAVLVLPYFLQTGQLDVRLRYVAGWSQANLPADIKQAVANLVRSAIDTPFSANMQTIKSGDATLTRFGPSVIDGDTKALLQPYKIVRLN